MAACNNLADLKAIRTKKKNALTAFEHQEQAAFIQWFRVTYRGVKIIAIPNAACTNPVAGRRFKEEGRESGVPDLYVPFWNLWLEMKRVNWKEPNNPREGSTAYNQKVWQAYLRDECKASVFVCRGFEEARRQIIDFVNINKEKEGESHAYFNATRR